MFFNSRNEFKEMVEENYGFVQEKKISRFLSCNGDTAVKETYVVKVRNMNVDDVKNLIIEGADLWISSVNEGLDEDNAPAIIYDKIDIKSLESDDFKTEQIKKRMACFRKRHEIDRMRDKDEKMYSLTQFSNKYGIVTNNTIVDLCLITHESAEIVINWILLNK